MSILSQIETNENEVIDCVEIFLKTSYRMTSFEMQWNERERCSSDFYSAI